MSGSVRLAAIASGATLAALLYFAWGVHWYWAFLAGAVAIIAVPMIHERTAGVVRRGNLKKVAKKARDLDRGDKP